MVEDSCRIKSLTLDARLKVEVVASGSACSALYANWVSRLQPLPYFYKITRVVTVKCLQSIRMSKDDAVSVGKVRTRENDFAREGCPRGVACKGLDVCSSMMPFTTIRAGHSGSRQWITPLFDGIVGKVYRELIVMSKGVFGCRNLHHLPLVNINWLILSEYH